MEIKMTEEQQKKVTFKQLSKSLKTLVVLGWIMTGLYTLAFLIGFMLGVLEVIA